MTNDKWQMTKWQMTNGKWQNDKWQMTNDKWQNAADDKCANCENDDKWHDKWHSKYETLQTTTSLALSFNTLMFHIHILLILIDTPLIFE